MGIKVSYIYAFDMLKSQRFSGSFDLIPGNISPVIEHLREGSYEMFCTISITRKPIALPYISRQDRAGNVQEGKRDLNDDDYSERDRNIVE